MSVCCVLTRPSSVLMQRECSALCFLLEGKDTNPIGLASPGPTLMTSFNFYDFLRSPVSKSSHTSGLRLQNMDSWGRQFSPRHKIICEKAFYFNKYLDTTYHVPAPVLNATRIKRHLRHAGHRLIAVHASYGCAVVHLLCGRHCGGHLDPHEPR